MRAYVPPTLAPAQRQERPAGRGDSVVANEAFFQRKQAAAVLKHGILSH
jgi:hypothetical protein